MEENKYNSLSEFEHDFGVMFSNVFGYFSSNSPQYLKAIELQRMFSEAINNLKKNIK